MSRATAGRLLLAVLVTAGLTAVPAAAQTTPAHDDVPTAVPDVPILLEWDGAEPATGTTAFLGAPVVAPGDSAARTVTVHNGGPTAARLRVSIVNVSLLDATAAEAAGVPSFYDDLSVTWRTAQDSGATSFSELAAHGTTTISEVPVEHGGSARLTIGYAFAADATSGNRADVARQAASFDLQLVLGPDLPAPTDVPTDVPSTAPPATAVPDDQPTTPGATPTSDATAGPTGPAATPSGDDDDGDDAAQGPLPTTGTQVRAVVAVALLAAAAGLVALAVGRRRAALVDPPTTAD